MSLSAELSFIQSFHLHTQITHSHKLIHESRVLIEYSVQTETVVPDPKKKKKFSLFTGGRFYASTQHMKFNTFHSTVSDIHTRKENSLTQKIRHNEKWSRDEWSIGFSINPVKKAKQNMLKTTHTIDFGLIVVAVWLNVYSFSLNNTISRSIDGHRKLIWVHLIQFETSFDFDTLSENRSQFYFFRFWIFFPLLLQYVVNFDI